MANEKNPRSRRRHNPRLLRPVRRTFFQKRRDAFFCFGRFARLHVVPEGTLDIVLPEVAQSSSIKRFVLLSAPGAFCKISFTSFCNSFYKSLG